MGVAAHQVRARQGDDPAPRRPSATSAPGWSSFWPRARASMAAASIPLDRRTAWPRLTATARTASSPISGSTAKPTPAQRNAVDALEQAGHPVARITRDRTSGTSAEEFFRWEIATAVAGAVIGINPFDQPDVEASKDKTRALTDRLREDRRHLPEEQPFFSENGIALYADPRERAELGRSHNTLVGYRQEPSRPRPCRREVGRLRGAAGLYRAAKSRPLRH